MRQVAMARALRSTVVVACLAVSPELVAQVPVASPTVTIQGHVGHPKTFSLNDLQAMPAVTVGVSRTNAKGVQAERYTGALLWPMLKAAEPIDAGPRTHLQHVIRATGHDGYTVALAIGELDPDFEGKQVLIAYAEDGQALPTLRLVVPADAKAGRSVRDLVSIEVD